MNTDHTEYENLNELLKTFFSFFKKILYYLGALIRDY